MEVGFRAPSRRPKAEELGRFGFPATRRRSEAGSDRAGRLAPVSGLTFVVAGLLLLAPIVAGAQELPLKRPAAVMPTATEEVLTCPAFEAPVGGAAVTPAVIDSLIDAGSQAAIAGDHATARLLLRQASFLDPANPRISYRLAGSLEALGQKDEARLEYCRYLALDPEASDSQQVRERIAGLARQPVAAGEPWSVALEEGIAAHEEGRFADAISAFTRAIDERPDNAASYYNRAVSRVAAGLPAEAVSDFQRYLELAPGAEDFEAVWALTYELRPAVAIAEPPPAELPPPVAPRRPPPAPDGVLVRGLLVPGLGQYATGRYVTGTLVLAGTMGALYFGTREELVTGTRQTTDPFGNPYEYPVKLRKRPNLALGFGGAVAIAAAGALESYFFARRERREFEMAEALTLSASRNGGIEATFSVRF
jgi:tetratricopeptide (TPR) repeat protein